MKLSFSTNAFVNYSVIEAIDLISEVGYTGVEILADQPHLYAPAITENELSKVKDRLISSEIQVSNLNANTAIGYYKNSFWEPLFEPSLANPEQSARKWRIEYTKKCIDMACFLKAPCVSITSGRIAPGIRQNKSIFFLKESLQEVLDYAEKKDIKIGIEYEPGLLIERHEELIALLEEIDSPWLGANLDIGHSYVIGENLQNVIESLSTRLCHIHLEDIKDRKHYHLIPGTGDMDFKKILEILKSIEYNGFITIELYTYPHKPVEAARESFSYLKTLETFSEHMYFS